MATCEDIRPLLGAYADAQLETLETEAVVVHLEQCGRCRQIVRDQQQVQHVLDAWAPPAVASGEWADMGRRLRAELEGRGEATVLKTRPRTEFLEQTPASTPALTEEELRPAVVETSAKAAPAGKSSGTSVLRVPRQRSKSKPAWTAHMIGIAATILVIVVGVMSQRLPVAPSGRSTIQTAANTVTPPPAIGPIRLAQSQDVAILDVQTLDPDYNVIIDAGNASGAATISVVLQEQHG